MSETDQIIGKSKHAEQLRKRLRSLLKSRSSCVIVGERGTGKTLFAHLLGSGDPSFQVVSVCGLTEQELQNRLAPCSNGTLLLEGVDQSSLRLQAIVAAFIGQEHHEVRILMSFGSTPEDLSQRHTLLDELYGRISKFETVEILPLRERPEDIPLLVRYFAPELIIDINGLEVLTKQLWLGNVAELVRVVRHCVASSTDGVFRLPAGMVEQPSEVVRAVQEILQGPEQQFDKSLDRLEGGIIQRALERFGFDTGQTARFLGMTEDTLEEKAGKLGLSLLRHSS